MKQKRNRVLKIVAAMLLVGNLTVQAQNVSFNNERLTLKQAFEKLESVSKYKIAYNPSQINVTRQVVLNQKNKTVQQVIEDLLKGTSYTYEVKGEQIVIVPQPTSDKTTITGCVVDDKGEGIIGASIMVKGTTNGIVTDSEGKFSLSIPIGSTIEVSYIGFKSKSVVVKNGKPITIMLSEDAKLLDELVITAYGTQTRRNVTGSMQTIDFADLQNIPAGQFTQKMQGQIAGVQVNQGTGVPGQGMSVKIRGAASLSTGANPLYVVDGFPIVGDINNINPNEIETMSILKDAAATALYGSRAAFGVVLITTKGAKSGKTTVDVNAYLGVQSVPQKGRPDMMNGMEWAQFRKENYEDLGLTVPEIYQNPSRYGEGYDWYDAMLRDAAIQDYSVTIKGGTDKFTTSVMLGYFDQDGVMLNSDYKRFSARANAMYKISPTLVARFSVAPTYSFENRPSSDGAFFSGGGLLANANLTPPIISWENEDGTMPVNINTPGVTQVETPNWVRSIKDTKNERTIKRILANASLEYSPITDLLIKTSASVDVGSEFHKNFQPSTAGRAFAAAANSINAYLYDANNRYYSWLWENTASYGKTFGSHHFDVLVGYTVQRFRSDFTAISGSNFADDRIQTINAALVKNNPTQDVQEWSMMSYLGRVNYDFMGRYLFSASIRRDGSSRFGINNKWGNFPAASIGWLVNEENFLKKADWLSLLKIRASYGL
ncbi:MAG: SusC/RagA family TonB-linked outer membrane protein, partial [Bacteroidales bacterium]|nr:SusC/RagA family TonB-linked outer membrane protein [Bacteroidales bacterium]